MNLLSKKVFLYFVFIFLIYCALQIGTMWDAGTHLIMGKNRLNYLLSFGKIDNELWFSKYFPGISYTLTAFLISIFPKQYEFQVLHLLNLIISLSGIYGLARLCKILFNQTISYIIFILLLFYPAYFGHMAINPKDTVIAVAFIWITYYVIKYLKYSKFSQNNNKILLILGFLTALGTGVNLTFVGVLIPLITFIFLEILFFKKIIDKNFSKKKFLIDFFKIVFISYSILVLFWPQVHSNVLTLPFKNFFDSVNIPPVGAPATLLNGDIYLSSDPTKFYVLLNLLLRTPEYLLILYPVSIYLVIKKNSFFKSKIKNFNYKVFFTLKILFFLILLLSFSPFPMYDGMRKFMFLLPFFLVLPSLGVYYILLNLSLKNFKFLAGSLFVFIGIFAYKFFSLTPYQYVYVNYLNGKTSENHYKFENDYLATSLKELFKKSEFLNNQNIRLNYCGIGKGKIQNYLKKNRFSKVKLVQSENDFDYVIMTNRVNWNSIDWKKPNHLEKAETCYESFKGEIVVSVERNGLVLSSIVKKK